MAKNELEKEQNKIVDVDVDTIGFVFKGANKKPILMTKSEEDSNMAENQEPLEGVQDDVETPTTETVDVAAEFDKVAEEKLPNAFAKFFKDRFGIGDDDEPEGEDETPAEDVEKSRLAEFEKRLGDFEAKTSELQAELVKAQGQLAEAQATARDKEFLAKAQEFKAIGNHAELAKHMSSLDETQREWFTEFVKSVDAQLQEAGLYNEFGKSNSPEQDDDPVQQLIKTGEAADVREAFLKMGEREGDAYLRQRRQEIKRG